MKFSKNSSFPTGKFFNIRESYGVLHQKPRQIFGHIFPVRNVKNQDDKLAVLNITDNPIITYTVTPKTGHTSSQRNTNFSSGFGMLLNQIDVPGGP